MTVRRLVVLGDSLMFWGQNEVLGTDHPATAPRRAAVHLTEITGETWEAVNVSAAGWCATDLLKVLRTDAEVRSTVAGADAVFLAATSKDGMLTPFPRPARAVIGRVPKKHRRRVVHALRRVVAKVTSHHFPYTRPGLFRRCWFSTLGIVRELAPSATVTCAAATTVYGPQTIHKVPENWRAPDGHPALVRALAAEAGVPAVDLMGIVDEWFRHHEPAPDYLHWTEPLHDLIGRNIAELLVQTMSARHQPVEMAA
jgi:hypothetical protein